MATPQAQVSPQDRAALFAQATRQYIHTLPTQSVSQEGGQVQFTLPKARLLSKIYLNVEAVATLKSTAASIARDLFSPYKILKSVSLDLNNGFKPFVVDGRSLYFYSLDRLNNTVYNVQNTSFRAMNYVDNAASAGGTTANIKFTVEMPIVLNPRDPVGLILLQNEASQVTLSVNTDVLAQAYSLNVGNNDQVLFTSLQVTPVVETFSIPSVPQAFPDLSVLKLVMAKSDTFAGNGQNILKMQVGTIYRKFMVYLEDNNGVPLNDSDLTSNFEVVFNQSDVPYSVKPSVLAHKNHSELGQPLPAGLFIFDFSNQGIPNLGGSRDYIDTSTLQEFWLRFSTVKAGKITVVSEVLTRLR